MYLERSHLQLLIELERTGSLTRAAEVQNITQSAASQRLREAERRLGLELTVKQGRSVGLTPAAKHIVQKAAAAEKILSDAETEAQWISRSSSPRLRLALTVFDRLDVAGLSDLVAAEGLGLTLLHRPSEQIGALLSDGLADAALTLAPLAPAGHVSTPVARDHLVAICAPDHPLAHVEAVTAEHIAADRYFTYNDQPSEGFEYEHLFRPAGMMPSRVERVESVGLLIEMVAAGKGLSILPALAVRLEALAGRVITRPLAVQIAAEWCLSSRQTLSAGITPLTLAKCLANVLEKGKV